jgi:hypothetical protein
MRFYCPRLPHTINTGPYIIWEIGNERKLKRLLAERYDELAGNLLAERYDKLAGNLLAKKIVSPLNSPRGGLGTGPGMQSLIDRSTRM